MKILMMYLGTMLLGTYGPFPDLAECEKKQVEQQMRVDNLKYPFRGRDDVYKIECHDIEGAKPLPQQLPIR